MLPEGTSPVEAITAAMTILGLVAFIAFMLWLFME